jgi:2-keto-4-pentenoate hydratase/2-oxohepta-3-ene-1,7-dioic acid hydratase in catechol pathway
MGPWIVTGSETKGRKIETRLNDKVVQSSNTDMMGFPVPRIISYITRFSTLMPGDVIATGTPAGIGPMKAGDVVEVEIEGLGTLKNHCEADPRG